MKKATKPKPRRKPAPIRRVNDMPYVVMLDSGEVIYRCETISQGVAFLVGRREGTLYGVLCKAASELKP